MRALTVQQPWAWAIVHGGKDVENRTQAWTYRGPLAIHAGMRWSDRGAESPLVNSTLQDHGWSEGPYVASVRHDSPHPTIRPLGAIIGVVDLVDVHTSDWCWEPDGLCSPWAESSYAEHGGRTRRDVVHLVLERPRPLADPIPAKGRLGLWTPDAELLGRIREQVPA